MERDWTMLKALKSGKAIECEVGKNGQILASPSRFVTSGPMRKRTGQAFGLMLSAGAAESVFDPHGSRLVKPLAQAVANTETCAAGLRAQEDIDREYIANIVLKGDFPLTIHS